MRRARVASHVHSDWSYDGRWNLDQISAAFGRRGYDAVLLAEHDRGFDSARWAEYRAACAAVAVGGALLIPGVEYSDPANAVHVPVWGDIPFVGVGLQTTALLPRVKEAGGLAFLAHPSRRDVLSQLDADLLPYLTGIELWNRKYDGYAPNRAAYMLLRQRPELVPLVSLDFHTARQFHPLAMLVDVDGEMTETSVCDAMRHRRLRPTAFRVPATGLARAPAWPAMRGIELSRKRVASRLKPLIRSGQRACQRTPRHP
jgi:hypothetical protein